MNCIDWTLLPHIYIEVCFFRNDAPVCVLSAFGATYNNEANSFQILPIPLQIMAFMFSYTRSRF